MTTANTYLLVVWGKPGLTRWTPTPGSVSQRSYLLTVWGGVDPDLHGPFSTPGEIEAAASSYLAGDHSIFQLVLEAGRPSIHHYGGHGWGVAAEILGPFEDEPSLEAAVARYFRNDRDYAVFCLHVDEDVAQVLPWSHGGAEEIMAAYPPDEADAGALAQEQHNRHLSEAHRPGIDSPSPKGTDASFGDSVAKEFTEEITAESQARQARVEKMKSAAEDAEVGDQGIDPADPAS